MGTLSKTIPSVGGYVAANKDIITYLRHASRAYIFSAALPPAQAAAANEAFKVILDEPWRIERLNQNTKQFIGGLKSMGFDTMLTETAIVPVLCGDDDMAFAMTREAQHNDVFVLPVVSPAVPEGLARLRATVTAAHEPSEIERAMDVIGEAGKKLGVIREGREPRVENRVWSWIVLCAVSGRAHFFVESGRSRLQRDGIWQIDNQKVRMKCPAKSRTYALCLEGFFQDFAQLFFIEGDWISFETACFQGLFHSFRELGFMHSKLGEGGNFQIVHQLACPFDTILCSGRFIACEEFGDFHVTLEGRMLG